MKKIKVKLQNHLELNKQTIGYFFLGIGLSMFLLNITLFINISSNILGSNILVNYYLTIISSVILMTYSLYNIYDND